MRDEPLGRFLEAVAAPKPTPGGGSVAALAGALSVALSRMVIGLARGKKGYEDSEADLAQLEGRGASIQGRLEDLMEADARAYDAVVQAMKLPRASEEEKRHRVGRVQAAYRRATEVPLETAEGCLDALELAEAAAKTGSRSAVTDAGVAVLLAGAGLQGAALNCRVNLAAIRDETFRSVAEGRLESLQKRADEIGRRAMAHVEERL